MNPIQLPQFKDYEEEANFWDNLDTADYMPDDEDWIHFDTPNQRAIRVAILPDIANRLRERAHAQGVSIETLINVLLIESIIQFGPSNQVGSPKSIN